MNGIRQPDNETASHRGSGPGIRPIQNNVPYLFLVRNMFFFDTCQIYTL
jgi:hypothetical protein